AAHDVDYGVRAAYVLQELVAQALALGRALYKSRYVHELYDSRRVFLRLIELSEEVQPLVRHRDHADVRVYRAEGVIGALCAGVSYRIEQRALAHVGQSDDTQFHISLHLLKKCRIYKVFRTLAFWLLRHFYAIYALVCIKLYQHT